MRNPFVTTGYAGPEFFCDREKETAAIIQLLTNGNNIALISQRRLGKTDLIRHCFATDRIRNAYYTFVIDIYSTNSIADFTACLGKAVLNELKPLGARAWEKFLSCMQSLKSGITYDAAGVPSWSLEVGDIKNPTITLQEIFNYIQNADRPCLVAIDEFQQITRYDDKNIEALLRTYIQYCSNANFIFSGSHREMMGAIFTSSARPFYQSVTIIDLPPIQKSAYESFCKNHFIDAGKYLADGVVERLYRDFDAITFYMQKVMNVLFMSTAPGTECKLEDVDVALEYILDFSSQTYEDLLYQLPEKQKQVLYAIARERRATGVTSADFVQKYSLLSASSVNSAIKGLVEKGLVSIIKNEYFVYDYFLMLWINREM